jgi:hypothetical protein
VKRSRKKKNGRKTFQGIANRQNGTRVRAIDSTAPVQRETYKTTRKTRETDMTVCTSSFIRTMTVGSGIKPDLLTP